MLNTVGLKKGKRCAGMCYEVFDEEASPRKDFI